MPSKGRVFLKRNSGIGPKFRRLHKKEKCKKRGIQSRRERQDGRTGTSGHMSKAKLYLVWNWRNGKGSHGVHKRSVFLRERKEGRSRGTAMRKTQSEPSSGKKKKDEIRGEILGKDDAAPSVE